MKEFILHISQFVMAAGAFIVVGYIFAIKCEEERIDTKGDRDILHYLDIAVLAYWIFTIIDFFSFMIYLIRGDKYITPQNRDKKDYFYYHSLIILGSAVVLLPELFAYGYHQTDLYIGYNMAVTFIYAVIGF